MTLRKMKTDTNFQLGASRWKLTIKGKKRIPREKTQIRFCLLVYGMEVSL